jgi:hypothetical protein
MSRRLVCLPTACPTLLPAGRPGSEIVPRQPLVEPESVAPVPQISVKLVETRKLSIVSSAYKIMYMFRLSHAGVVIGMSSRARARNTWLITKQCLLRERVYFWHSTQPADKQTPSLSPTASLATVKLIQRIH